MLPKNIDFILSKSNLIIDKGKLMISKKKFLYINCFQINVFLQFLSPSFIETNQFD